MILRGENILNSKSNLICDTTKEQRKEIAEWSLSVAALSGREADDDVKDLFNRYVNGEIEISEVERMTLERYKG